jgi:hypothetical protein
MLEYEDETQEHVERQGGRENHTSFRQVQECVGLQSVWTSYHARIAGVAAHPLLLQERDQDMLSLYRETAYLLKPHLSAEHWRVIEQTLQTVGRTFSEKGIR